METFLKIMIVILLFAILGFNIFTYLERIGENVVDNTITGAEEIIDDTEKTIQDIANIPKYIEDDVSASTIQSRGKQQFCYVGKDRGHRSCIEMDEDDICQSNKIYHTKERCVNPRLR